jgi:hypothetical protein
MKTHDEIHAIVLVLPMPFRDGLDLARHVRRPRALKARLVDLVDLDVHREANTATVRLVPREEFAELAAELAAMENAETAPPLLGFSGDCAAASAPAF